MKTNEIKPFAQPARCVLFAKSRSCAYCLPCIDLDDRTIDRFPQPRYAIAMPSQPPLDTVFSALADPTRRAILTMLLEDDMAVTDVAEPFEISLAAISKHLGVLTRAGLITQEKRGRVIWCKLDTEAMRDASVWMQSFGQFEALDLDAFETFLERELKD